MRKISACLLAGLVCLFVFGCAATLSEGSKTHTTRVERNMKTDLKLMAEDWDRFWMVDHPSRLTPNNM